ncbi:hypothetical protein [Acidithiobacillus sulfuriphilus]|uniref:Uncharacterized protein n=2 Tax=Acidithiobacillus sulfuriphilus TaxID=1867749 RepID=A0A3M8R4G8_9PROT|nr:hypothetical protein [Acidithiobacillus sulfuriphilus]RNF62971.1 hypothetical protein EC580_06875 [Acidithiobacillus sulfuriphilus]
MAYTNYSAFDHLGHRQYFWTAAYCDANDNLTSDGIRSYAWDVENLLVGIGYVEQPEKKYPFQHDGLDRRAVMVALHS